MVDECPEQSQTYKLAFVTKVAGGCLRVRTPLATVDSTRVFDIPD
jgi:hypothetical protein